MANDDIEDLGEDVKRAFDIYIRSVAEELEGHLQNRAQTETSSDATGTLARSWSIQQRSQYEFVASSNVGYAFVVSEGSEGPYTIRPREKQALRFEVNGEVVLAKKVTHPGIEGNEYIRKAIDDTRAKLETLAQRAFDRAGL